LRRKDAQEDVVIATSVAKKFQNAKKKSRFRELPHIVIKKSYTHFRERHCNGSIVASGR
jgi:hypothetical protein